MYTHTHTIDARPIHTQPPTYPTQPPTPQVFRAILKSEVLREAISDLSDLPGASTVRVTVSNDEPHFHLSSGGNYGSLQLFLPRTSEVGAWGGNLNLGFGVVGLSLSLLLILDS